MKPPSANRIILGTAMSLMIISCSQKQEGTKKDPFSFLKKHKQDTFEDVVEPEPKQNQPKDKANETPVEIEFVEPAYQILKLLKNWDIKGLSPYIHSDFGLTFSPYAFLNDQRILSVEEIAAKVDSDSVEFWGFYDGSGDSIMMTFSEYFKEFVYCADFAGLADTTVNTPGHSGNSLNNFDEVFPDGQYIDFCVPGTEEYGFLDWRTLRMGFVKKGKKWYLVALIHDEWTI